MNTTTMQEPLSVQDFTALGLNQIAYVRLTRDNGITGFAIHTADGQQVALLPTREAAVATILQNEMQPVSLH